MKAKGTVPSYTLDLQFEILFLFLVFAFLSESYPLRQILPLKVLFYLFLRNDFTLRGFYPRGLVVSHVS